MACVARSIQSGSMVNSFEDLIGENNIISTENKSKPDEKGLLDGLKF